MSDVENALIVVLVVTWVVLFLALDEIKNLKNMAELHGEWLKAHDRLYLRHIHFSHKLTIIPKAVEGGRSE